MTRKQFCLILSLSLVVGLFAGKDNSSRADDTEMRLLGGLKEVLVDVEDLDFSIERLGLTTGHLREDVETKLKLAGIKVRSEKESMTRPGIPRLHIIVEVLGTSSENYAAHVRVELREPVNLVRNHGMEVFATTWTSGRFGVTPTLSDVKVQEQQLIDTFISEYLSANPH